MAKIAYKAWKPAPDTVSVILQAEEICADYAQQGYDLTLRQLYYQFVARGLLPNNQRSYDRLGGIINDARLAGYLDWNYIVDRTRNLRHVSHWNTPGDIIRSAASSFRLDKWATQPYRVEVWVEKEALAGVVGQSADREDVAWFSCRGYVSQSETWAAAQRHLAYIQEGQAVVVLHLGDHDPSGIDMTRDIKDRLETFITYDYYRAVKHESEFIEDEEGVSIASIWEHMRQRCGGREPLEVRRIALNYDQVQQYNPPPNPAKLTDSRVKNYISLYGNESWELDALDPATLDALISAELYDLKDPEAYAHVEERENADRLHLREASQRWADVAEYLGGAE